MLHRVYRLRVPLPGRRALVGIRRDQRSLNLTNAVRRWRHLHSGFHVMRRRSGFFLGARRSRARLRWRHGFLGRRSGCWLASGSRLSGGRRFCWRSRTSLRPSDLQSRANTQAASEHQRASGP